MVRLYIAEQNALTIGGHYYSYTRCVAEAAVKHGLEVYIFHNRRFNGKWVIDGVTPIAAFPLTWSEAELYAGRWWGIGNIAHDFEAAARQAPPRPGDHVLFHTIGYAELVFLLDYFVGLSARTNLPYYHLLLRYDPAQMRDDLKTFRPLFLRLAASEALRRHVRFHADTVPLARAYEELSRLPFSTLPIPFEQTVLRREWPRHVRSPADPLVIAYLGDARLEKGYGLLPAAIAELRQTRPGVRARFVLQSNFNTPGGEPGMGAARDALQEMPDVELSFDPLDEAAYYERLLAADAVMIPYDAKRYRERSSGILVEALAAGKPVVTTVDSWMASQVTPDHAVVFGEDRTLGSALVELVDRYDSLAARAQASAPQWQMAASGDAFIKQLLSSASSISGPAPMAPRVLVVMNGDAMVLRNGASRIARSQFAYLQAAGYRICALFLCYDPDGISGGMNAWTRELAERVKSFDFEGTFVARASQLMIDSWRLAGVRPQSIESDLLSNRCLDFSAEFITYLRHHAIDAVVLNYITAYPVIEALGLSEVPVICEMHDVQALQKGIYGSRPVSQDDIDAECALLGHCAHLISLNPNETLFVRDRLPKVPIVTTGVFFDPPPSKIASLAGCRTLAEVVEGCNPRGDAVRVLEQLGRFENIDLLFVGSNHLPNVSGLRWFLERVFLPGLAPRGKTLLVAGSVAEIGDWPSSPQIAYLGRVSDLAPLYAAAAITVLPLLEGAGMPVKTIEALHYGLPVVGTSHAMRGIDKAELKGFVVADEPSSWLRATLSLLSDVKARRHAAEEARNTAARIADPVIYTNVMNDVFLTVLRTRALVARRESPAPPSVSRFEWPLIGAANIIVRDWLDEKKFDEAALDRLLKVSKADADALLRDIIDCLIVNKTALILDRHLDLLRLVARRSAIEALPKIGALLDTERNKRSGWGEARQPTLTGAVGA